MAVSVVVALLISKFVVLVCCWFAVGLWLCRGAGSLCWCLVARLIVCVFVSLCWCDAVVLRCAVLLVCCVGVLWCCCFAVLPVFYNAVALLSFRRFVVLV